MPDPLGQKCSSKHHGERGASKMNFVLIGCGYIAQKHLRAIKETGHNLLAVFDPTSHVGILDTYFISTRFFNEFVEFHNFCVENLPDYVSICAPNFLHLPYIIWAKKLNLKVVCEKPIVMNLDELKMLENFDNINTILQLRLNPEIVALKANLPFPMDMRIKYYTPRGDWYFKSWKTDTRKSGGLLMNIGIHLFDLSCYILGEPLKVLNAEGSDVDSKGSAQFTRGRLFWELSIKGDTPHRQMYVNDQTIDLNKNFVDSHLECYQNILCGKGVKPSQCAEAYKLIDMINQNPSFL
jgi:UDP-N-acetyl-2-amino-2-deoxyglucuronate dehydrogenase